MGFKILMSSWGLHFFFQNYPMYVIFWKIILKVWISGSNGLWFFYMLCVYILLIHAFLKNHAKIIGFHVVFKSQHFSRLSHHNVPSGSSANPYGERRRREFDGVGRMGRSRKVSFKFLHTLWVYRLCICILIYEIKIVTNILMGFKISC